jgi:hypothetical protein
MCFDDSVKKTKLVKESSRKCIREKQEGFVFGGKGVGEKCMCNRRILSTFKDLSLVNFFYSCFFSRKIFSSAKSKGNRKKGKVFFIQKVLPAGL